MFVKIELLAGPKGRYPTRGDVDLNIKAIERAIAGKMTAADAVLLLDTKPILEGIKKQLPNLNSTTPPVRES